MQKIRKGNEPDLVSIKKVKAYREKGLSYRNIAERMKLDVAQIWRWHNNYDDKLKRINTKK